MTKGKHCILFVTCHMAHLGTERLSSLSKCKCKCWYISLSLSTCNSVELKHIFAMFSFHIINNHSMAFYFIQDNWNRRVACISNAIFHMMYKLIGNSLTPTAWTTYWSAFQWHIHKFHWLKFHMGKIAKHKEAQYVLKMKVFWYMRVSTGNWLPTFQRRLLPPSAATTLKIEDVSSSELLVRTSQCTLCHVPEYFKLNEQRCENRV
jgi:hypothetical protein